MRSHAATPPAPALVRAVVGGFTPRLPPIAATLRLWRQRARDRAELAGMDYAERRDLPFARDISIQAEARKPFWRE